MNGLFAIMKDVVGGTRLSLMYIDPATTSYIIQIGAGLIIAVGTVLGIYRNKIKRFFKKNKDEAIPQTEKNNDAKKEVITADDLMDDDD